MKGRFQSSRIGAWTVAPRLRASSRRPASMTRCATSGESAPYSAYEPSTWGVRRVGAPVSAGRGSGVEGDGEVDEGHDAADAGRHEGEGEGADHRGPDGTDDRAEDEAAHLRRGVEAEGFAALVLLGLLDDRAARRRVVHADPDAGDEAQDEELEAGRGRRGAGACRASARRARRASAPRRDVRSASQPKIGSKTSRAAGQAARMTPSVAGSTPCSRRRAAAPGSSAPKPTTATNSATRMGTIGRQRSFQRRARPMGSKGMQVCSSRRVPTPRWPDPPGKVLR